MVEKVEKGDIAILQKSIYGLTESARVFYKVLIEYLKENMGFKCFMDDPCLLAANEIMIGIYVDDIIIIGVKESIESLILGLKKRFTIKHCLKVEEFIGCEFQWIKHKQVTLHQSKLINKLQKIFGPDVQDMQRYSTPEIPGKGLEIISSDDMENCINWRPSCWSNPSPSGHILLIRFSANSQ